MIAGQINLVRSLAHHEIWLCEKFSRGQAWADLLLLANDAERELFIKGIRVKVRRGQLVWSQHALSERWKWTRVKTSGFLQWLAERSMIIVDQSNLTTVITITNYDIYQSKPATEKELKTDLNYTTHISADDTADDTAKVSADVTQKGEGGSRKEENARFSTDGFCPADEEVFDFAASFAGEPATGTPGPIENAFASSWLARMHGREKFPVRWQRAIVAEWRSHCIGQSLAHQKKPSHVIFHASQVSPIATRIALEQEAKKLRAEMDLSPLRPNSDADLNFYTPKELSAGRVKYSELQKKLVSLEQELGAMV